MTDAQKQLTEANIGLVPFIVRKHYPDASEIGTFGDRVQIGYVGLCRAAQTFDPEKGFTFATYAVKCIRNELNRELRTTRAARRTGETLSLDKLYGDASTPLLNLIPDPGADSERLIEAREAYKAIEKAFDGEPVLLAVATRQMTQAEAADLLGISQPHVGRRIKAILKNYFEKEDTHGKDQHDCLC